MEIRLPVFWRECELLLRLPRQLEWRNPRFAPELLARYGDNDGMVAAPVIAAVIISFCIICSFSLS